MGLLAWSSSPFATCLAWCSAAAELVMIGEDVSRALQWMTLVAYGLVALACVVALARQRRALAGVAVALLVVALNHVAYYVVFLLFPDWLGALETMLWSIVLRLHVAGTALLALAVAWRESADERR